MATVSVKTDRHDESVPPLQDMPLLDAVQSLVEKERTLMQLKVAEAADEINAWKSKYNQLAESTMNLSNLHKDLVLPDPERDSHWTRLKKTKGEGHLSSLKFIDLSNENISESDLSFLSR